MTSLKNDTSKHKVWAALIVWVGLLCIPNAWADRYTNDRDDVSQDDDRRDAQDTRRNRRDKRRYRKPDRSDQRDAGRSNQRKSRTDRADRDRRSDRDDAAPRTRRAQPRRSRRDRSTNRRRTRRDDRYDRSSQDRDDVRRTRRTRSARRSGDRRRSDRSDRSDRYDDRGDRYSDDNAYRRRRRNRRVNRYGRVNRDDRDDRGYRRAARYDSDSSGSVSRSSESLLRPGTRSHSAYLGFAPGLRTDGLPHQFGFHAGYGYHFFGHFAGPVLGLDLSIFGLGNVLRVQTVLAFAWQFQLGNRGLYIAPFAGIGHLHVEGTSYSARNVLYETAILLFGGELTLMFHDRIRLSLRVPFAVSFDPWFPGVAVSPTLTVGVTF